MRLAHDTIAAGHLAGRKTLERVRLNFFWPNMKTEICSYTSSCVPCQLKALARRKDHVPITPVVRPVRPWVNNNNDNKRQFVRRRKMSVDITRAPYGQSRNVFVTAQLRLNYE